MPSKSTRKASNGLKVKTPAHADGDPDYVKVGGPESKKAATKIAWFIGNRLPDAQRRVQELMDNAIRYTSPSAFGLKDAKINLLAVQREFGSDVLAQTVGFLSEKYSDARREEAVRSIALCFKKGKADLLEKTAAFMERHSKSFWDFSSLLEAVELRGVEELEQGMDLATPAGPEPEPPVLPHCWRPEEVTASRREAYAMLTWKMGFARLKVLTSRLKNEEELTERDIRELASACAYAKDQELEIKRVFNAIVLVKKVKADHNAREPDHKIKWKSLGTTVYEALRSGRFGRADVKEVLVLMADNGIESISRQDFNIALKYYRRPNQREIVLEAFKKKAPTILTWASIADGLSIGITGYVEAGMEATERALDELASQDAHLRTREIMQERCLKLGIFGSDRDFVQELSQNPVFVTASLTLRRSEARSLSGLVDRATQIFGSDSVRAVTKFAESGMEPEYALALLRTGNPEVLANVLRRASKDSRLPTVRIINHHGLQLLRRATGVAREAELDNGFFIQPIADALTNRGKKIIPIRPQRFNKPLKLEHELQLRFFYSQPPLWQRNIARAVKIYRTAYNTTYSRIRYA